MIEENVHIQRNERVVLFFTLPRNGVHRFVQVLLHPMSPHPESPPGRSPVRKPLTCIKVLSFQSLKACHPVHLIVSSISGRIHPEVGLHCRDASVSPAATSDFIFLGTTWVPSLPLSLEEFQMGTQNGEVRLPGNLGGNLGEH
jgi:hypothetical protein